MLPGVDAPFMYGPVTVMVEPFITCSIWVILKSVSYIRKSDNQPSKHLESFTPRAHVRSLYELFSVTFAIELEIFILPLSIPLINNLEIRTLEESSVTVQA